MNAPIRRVAVAFLLMFGALLVNANYIQVVRADELNARSDNRRVLLDEYANARGPILVGNVPVATSVRTDGPLEFLRRYPSSTDYAHATGFYSFMFGRSSTERVANDILSGNDDRLFVRRVVDLLTGRQPAGGSVVLTLNAAAQSAAMRELSGYKGAVVAIDPRTGAILAMASTPSYDPNRLAVHDVTAQQEAWDELNADPAKPMLNRAIAQTLPPGSSFKLVTAAAALESGDYSPDSTVPGPAVLDLPQTSATLSNSSGRACGPNDETSLIRALTISCNTAFAAIGMDLGDDALRAQAERFGFETNPLGGYNAAASRFPENPDAPQTAMSAIGQFDVRVTPLQMAMVSAAIANNGVLMRPYLISELRAPNLEPIEQIRPEQLSRAVSPQTAADLTRMMISVVQGAGGTGSRAQIEGIDVAGKTGTAQNAEGKPPYAWFTSFAPADDPQVAVAVVIEEADISADDISGGRIAAPIAKAVMEAVLNR